jgi:hypothetical protein
MITRQDIDNEAAFVQHLIELTNPTKRLHSATPWVASGEHEITAAGATIAQFRETGDRDVALYFANSHAAIIGLLRNMAGAWDFVEMGATTDETLKDFAHEQSELARVYADLFRRLGKPDDAGVGTQ